MKMMITAGDSIVLEYVVKVVSVIEKPAETFVIGVTWKSRSHPSIKNEAQPGGFSRN